MFQRALSPIPGSGDSKSLKYERGSCYPNDYVKQVGDCIFIVGQGSGNNANTAYLRGYVSEGNVVVTHDGAKGGYGYTATYENGTLTIKMVNSSAYYPNPDLELYYEE